jgi:hypothetical protein
MGLSDVAMNDIDYMDFELGKRENCAHRAGAVESKHGGCHTGRLVVTKIAARARAGG